jgi:hypothetical protein
VTSRAILLSGIMTPEMSVAATAASSIKKEFPIT